MIKIGLSEEKKEKIDMTHKEKIKPILDDLEDKEIEFAGGSVVGMMLSITNSLIHYICNLTIGKKKYAEVEEEVLAIKEKAIRLRNEALAIIDQDQQVLEKILAGYKKRKEEPEFYEKANREGVEFCVQVTKKGIETLKLVEQISKVGNRMLASDFQISNIYAFASVEASIVNIEVNLKPMKDEEFKKEIKKIYTQDYEEAKKIKERIQNLEKGNE